MEGIAKGYGVSSGSFFSSALELSSGDGSQLCEYTETDWIVPVKGWILLLLNYVSILKLLLFLPSTLQIVLIKYNFQKNIFILYSYSYISFIYFVLKKETTVTSQSIF